MHQPRRIQLLGFATLACAPLSVALGEGSELPDGSVTITSLPFVDTGDTSDNLHDYDAVCPWASDSPDVFYAYTPPEDVPSLEIYLCDSGYDTKVYVLDSSFTTIACDDDGCDSNGGGGAYRSMLRCVDVRAGETIHIAIDGWSGDAGTYDLIVDVCFDNVPCIFGVPFAPSCPGDATDEGEPCLENVDDLTNGGCNVTPARFTPVSCGDAICGSLYQTTQQRDTDWFELSLTDAAIVTMRAVGECELQFGRVEENDCLPGVPNCSCISGGIDPEASVAPCVESHVADDAPPGESWWFLSTTHTGAVPCAGEEPGNDYLVAFTCSIPPCCDAGDANADGTVDFNDLVIALANWGPCAAPPCCALGDANGDATIGFGDVVILLASWGPCGG